LNPAIMDNGLSAVRLTVAAVRTLRADSGQPKGMLFWEKTGTLFRFTYSRLLPIKSA
jgi:hypothetical protein